jgi:hypothetical protein
VHPRRHSSGKPFKPPLLMENIPANPMAASIAPNQACRLTHA